MQFEWDENKNKSNITKHGISFLFATEIFSDPLAIETDRIIGCEERIQIIGKIEAFVISVVYTVRKSNYRLISARLASKKERAQYEQKRTT